MEVIDSVPHGEGMVKLLESIQNYHISRTVYSTYVPSCLDCSVTSGTVLAALVANQQMHCRFAHVCHLNEAHHFVFA